MSPLNESISATDAIAALESAYKRAQEAFHERIRKEVIAKRERLESELEIAALDKAISALRRTAL